MLLTRTRTPRDPSKFPATQLFLLALVRVAEPIALTSIFPYAWKLVIHFNVTSDANAAFYAGILISAFSLAEACSGMYWGAYSDRIGRKPVLLMGCAGTLASLLVVGLAPSFWVALFGRILGGILNGNIGVVQTMVGELVTNPEHEPKAYAVMPFVWSVGTIIGPSIGGYFADPSVNFPSVFPSSSIFAKFPYLLPNVICSALLCIAMVAGYFFLEETHPDMQLWESSEGADRVNATTPLFPTSGATDHAAANLTAESYGTFDAVDSRRDEIWRVRSNGEDRTRSPSREKVFTKPVVMMVIALGIFTYHAMTYDHLLPIFFQHERVDDISAFDITYSPFAGGLGLSTQQVGIIMSFNGIIALFVQGAIFPLMAAWLGVWRLFVVVTVGHPIAYFIVPYLTVLPTNWLYPGIYTCLAIRNCFSILAFPLLLILIKETSPASHLGKINGLAASTGAACRTVASPVAGLLYGVSIDLRFTPLAWWSSALVAVLGALQIPFLIRIRKASTTQVRPATACRFMPEQTRQSDVVRIQIEDTDSDYDV